jgi:integrase
LATARTAAQNYLSQIAGGGDPQADRKAVAAREAARLDRALDSYAEHLQRRQVVNGAQIVRNLKRYLPSPAGTVDLASIDRPTIAGCLAKIEKQSVVTTERRTVAKIGSGTRKLVAKARRKVGGPGAAADFRTKAHAFFNWAVNAGMIYANPIAGWRRERVTRAEMTSRTGRALAETEIKAIWQACDVVPAPYGAYVRLLLLAGQRRTETARMQWTNLDPIAKT